MSTNVYERAYQAELDRQAQEAHDRADRAGRQAQMAAEAHRRPMDAAELIQAHGGNAISIGHQEWILPDGWTVRNCTYWGEERRPGDGGELAVLTARKRYHELAAERAEKDFKKLKAALTGQKDAAMYGLVAASFRWAAREEGLYGPAPGPGHAGGVKGLEMIRDAVLRERQAVAELDKQIEAMPEVQERRRQEEESKRIDQEIAARRHEEQQRVAAIEI